MTVLEQMRQAISAAPHGGFVQTTGKDCNWLVAGVTEDMNLARTWWDAQTVPARVWQVKHREAHLIWSK